MKPIKDVLKYKELLFELVKRDIKIKYRRSVLGILWSILNPLLFMGVMTMIFSVVFKSNIKNFPIYFLCGQILFTFFSEATSFAQSAVIDNASLIKKVYLPKYIFPLSKVCSSMVNLSFSFIAILVIMLLLQYKPPATSLLFFIPIVYIFMFTLGISLIISSLAVFFRDTVHIYSIFLTILSYFSAVFYPVEIIPVQYRGLISLNPIYLFIKYFRTLFIEGSVPNIDFNILCFSYSAIAIIVGYIIFKKSENKFILYI
ncbi:TPA: ABC transporter permease [Clostridioides difficile]